MRFLVTLLLVCFISFKAFAQPKNASPLSTTETKLTHLSELFEKEDSALTHFEKYRPLRLAQDLGNITSPYRFLYWKPLETIGFRTGWFVPTDYYLNPSTAKYYKTSTPYTIATYVTGQRPGNYLDYLQQVKFLHTQNWGPLFNIGININSNRCNGFTTNAEGRTSAAQLFAWFRTPNNRYQIIANANFNSASNKINGGIISDSSYEYSSGLTREIEGLISDSSLYRNKIHHYSLKHFYRFGNETVAYNKRIVRRDSSTIDTILNIETKLQLAHQIGFQRATWDYRDNIYPYKNIFENYYFDTLRTKDTLHQNSFTNLFDATFKVDKSMQLYGAYENKIHRIFQYGNPAYTMHESLLHAGITKIVLGDSATGISINENLSYCFFNNYKEFTQGDYLSDASAAKKFNQWRIDAHWILAAQAPTLLQTYNPGNHFYWINYSLEKTTTNAFTFEVSDHKKRTSLKFTGASLNHFTYFDTLALPAQTNKLMYSSLFWKQDFKLKALHYSHQAVWQKSSVTSALSLPELALSATLMYDGNWFKKALHIQFGVTTEYFTKYEAPAFMPSVNVFYEQHKKLIGNYIQLNGFVNLQIQRVRIFLISEHFNQGMSGFGTASYITPHYPLTNRAFRFGICWSFYN